MMYSDYQLAIFDAMCNSKDNLAINAVAGSGKTFTMITKGLGELYKGYNSRHTKTLVLAFNVSIKNEFEEKAKSNYQDNYYFKLSKFQTYNAFGNSVIYNHINNPWSFDSKKISVNKNKLNEFIYKQSRLKRFNNIFIKAINYTKNMANLSNKFDVDDLFESCTYELELLKNQEIVDIEEEIVRLWTIHYKHNMKILENNEIVIDFNDQLYLPILLNLPVPTYNTVLVDEYQDISPIQELLISKTILLKNRLIVAGDPYQSIYSWRGSTTNSLKKFIEEYKAKEMPLSICYRCPKDVIEKAQMIVPHISYWDKHQSNDSNNIHHINNNSFIKELSIKKGDILLSRQSNTLIEYWVKLIKEGYSAYIKGNDIKTVLVTIFNQLLENDNSYSYDSSVTIINEYCEQTLLKLPEYRHEEFLQIVNCLEIVVDLLGDNITLKSCMKQLDLMFLDENSDIKDKIILMTIHKSKGLEADRIWILNYSKLSKCVNGEEGNLHYVALTRCKKTLYLVK